MTPRDKRGSHEPNVAGVTRNDDLGWKVPWRGGTGVLSVERSAFRRLASIVIDGQVVAQAAKPTLENPWVECPIAADDTPIIVVQMQPQRYWNKTLVFVDGLCVDDGVALEIWRTHKPAAMDRFEQGFRGFLWGPVGIIALGVICALPQLAQFGRTSDQSWLAGAGIGFLIGAGWLSAVIALVRWLRTKRSWPWRLRRFIVGFVLLGAPVLTVLTVQALTSVH